MRKAGRNAQTIGLVALFAAFVLSALVIEQMGQRETAPNTPSSYNARPHGVKALYLLLEAQGFHVGRLQTTWDGLQPGDGLLILAEPFVRFPSPEELKILRTWMERGGSLLYLAAPPARPLDPKDPIAGDIALSNIEDTHKESISQAKQTFADSPLTHDVTQISGAGSLRLTLPSGAPYEILCRDSRGILLVEKRIGKGRLIMSVADLSSNAGIQSSDNAIVLVNVARETAAQIGRNVVFDEYHQGVGFANTSVSGQARLQDALPRSFLLAFSGVTAFGILLLYNGNQRFGSARLLPVVGAVRGTDYIGSMARLYRRAKASDAALVILYQSFWRDLVRNLNVPQDLDQSALAVLAARQFGIDGTALAALLMRCQSIQDGQELTETELLTLAQQIEFFRRSCQRVGI